MNRAPSERDLFNFEDAIEAATLSILQKEGVIALASRSKEKVRSFETAIQFEAGATNGHYGRKPNGSKEYDQFSGTLEVEVSADREMDDKGRVTGPDAYVYSRFAEMRSVCRVALQESRAPYTEKNLPFLFVSRIRPAGTVIGLREATLQDVSTLRFDLVFSIRAEAWPV